MQVEPLISGADLGSTFDITVQVSNEGASTIPSGSLFISLPGNATTTALGFYIYVVDPLMRGGRGMDSVVCGGGGINPDNLVFSRRAKRSKR